MRSLIALLLLPIHVLATPAALPLDQTLDAMLATRFPSHLPGLAALVLDNGKPVLRKAYGRANLELGVPLEPGHVFRIGSTTKMFTATAIMMLVEEGKVALDAPIGSYLPNAPAHWSHVTVEHLLTHTSGIPNMTNASGFWRTTARLEHTPEQVIEPMRAAPLGFDPGTRFAYCNTGYMLLGMIVASVSGGDFFDFIHTRITKPLGLRHTRSGVSNTIIPGLVSGYQAGPAPGWFIALSNIHAAGGMVSTVDDLAVFMLALQGGKLIGKASLERMNASHMLPDGSATGYGLGQWVRKVNGNRLVGHPGYILNFYSNLEMDIDANIVAVTLHNGDRFGGDNEVLSKEIIEAVQKELVKTAPPAGPAVARANRAF